MIGEPVFQSAVLPWDSIIYWYITNQLSNQLQPSAIRLPGHMTIYGMAVEYDHLWKIRADAGICEGFDIKEFDKIIQVYVRSNHTLQYNLH